MFTISVDRLNHCSADSGYLKNELEKVFRLIDVLNTMRGHPFLKDCFVLKGGTAINLFYYSLPRLSVDVDLNYIRHLDKDKMHEDRKEIESIVQDVFYKEYEIRKSKDAHALLQFEFRYNTISKSSDKLKLDINFLQRIPYLEPRILAANWFGYSAEFLVLTLEEILASKIIAMLTRYTPRDLFDIYQTAIQTLDLDKQKLHELVLLYALISRERVFEIFKVKWGNLSDQDINRFLYPMLISGHRPSRDEMIESVQAFISPLISISEHERDALEQFYMSGELHLQGLITNEVLKKRYYSSPALQWKIGHLKDH
ncbi:MAG: nucleotidyl transferase AbiEii/AbiGii toxin family protein [Candidatus Brocadiales bacterium]|nr:nucleotidyl transferase AbiEii/AbiGii toxin family protein [Candidatus Brocadiales bacterium]